MDYQTPSGFAVGGALILYAIGSYFLLSITDGFIAHTMHKHSTNHGADSGSDDLSNRSLRATILAFHFALIEVVRRITAPSNFQWANSLFVPLLRALTIGAVSVLITLSVLLVWITYSALRAAALTSLEHRIRMAQNTGTTATAPTSRFLIEDLKYMALVPIDMSSLTPEEAAVVISERARVEEQRGAGEQEMLADLLRHPPFDFESVLSTAQALLREPEAQPSTPVLRPGSLPSFPVDEIDELELGDWDQKVEMVL